MGRRESRLLARAGQSHKTAQNALSRWAALRSSAAALATIVFCRSRVKAAVYELKCASDLTADHPVSIRIVQMWKNIEAQTAGRVHTQYFPNSQLGSASAMLGQVRSGALDFYWANPNVVGAVVPAANLGQVGFAFRNEDEAIRVMTQGPLPDYLRGEMTAKGLVTLRQMWTTGMYGIIGGHAINTPEDIRGFKVRVSAGRIQVDLFKELGASPIALPAAEIYPALQTKLIDGTTMGLISMDYFKVWEVAKHISMTNHAWSGFWMLASDDLWKRLPSDIQQVIERNHTEQCLGNHRDAKAQYRQASALMQQRGLTVTDVQPAPFVKMLASYYKDWSTTLGTTAWSSLEGSLGRKVV